MTEEIDQTKNIKAYDGSGAFIFVSYAHKDSDEVMPIIAYYFISSN